eukprot:jgi/Galph1/1078/GphlegSOOS_G5797.1
MNRPLLNPFESQTVPEVLTENISECYGNCVAFNRNGNILAVGSKYGILVIVDFDTYGPVFQLQGHRDKIISLSWSRNSKEIISCGQDNTVRVWDLPQQKEVACLQTPNTPFYVERDPKDSGFCILDLEQQLPVIVNFKDLQGTFSWNSIERMVKTVDSNEAEETKQRETAQSDANNRNSVRSRSLREYFCFFIKGGEEVLRMDSSGNIVCLSFPDLVARRRYSLAGKSIVRQVIFERKRRLMAVITQDRYIRLFHGGSFIEDREYSVAPIAQFVDIVGRNQWNCACFSDHCDYLLAGLKGSVHKILVWRIDDGQLERTLEGPNETIVDISWNPCRNIIVSCGGSGSIYVWTKDYTENWSAFAPEFIELEENEEYVEREDEFDYLDGMEKQNNDEPDDENQPVDIISEFPNEDSDDSCDKENGFILPVIVSNGFGREL